MILQEYLFQTMITRAQRFEEVRKELPCPGKFMKEEILKKNTIQTGG